MSIPSGQVENPITTARRRIPAHRLASNEGRAQAFAEIRAQEFVDEVNALTSTRDALIVQVEEMRGIHKRLASMGRAR